MVVTVVARSVGASFRALAAAPPRRCPAPSSSISSRALHHSLLTRIAHGQAFHGVGAAARMVHYGWPNRSFSTSTGRSNTDPSPKSQPSSSPSSSSLQPSLRAIRANTARQLHEAHEALASLQAQINLMRSKLPVATRRSSVLISLLLAASALLASYHLSPSFKTVVIATQRCGAIGYGVVRCIISYKVLFSKTWSDDAEGKRKRHDAYEECHTECAVRIREILKSNGGIYIKLGQHLSSIALIPLAWSQTMLPLQDQCIPTPLSAIESLFLSDVGAPLSTFFSSFDPEPIGVASLAQVHIATERETGRRCAVKVMHEGLEAYCAVDMIAVVYLLGVVKAVFPSFEFTWLGEEMQTNLPLEMDFRHEAANAARCQRDFSDLKKTTLVIPEVLWAKRRVLVMEFIEGSRIDDLGYLARHNIDRNLVAQSLSHIMSRMIYITGFFHADSHHGNLLIRPSQPGSRSPYNFEIVLLDHGLYFEMPPALRVDYAHLWLSLIAPSSPAVELERRKYAYRVGNIDQSLYPIFQAAITGRAALENAGENGEGLGSMMEMGERTREEERRLRHAVVGTGEGDGLLGDILSLLRKVPRRMLMVFKVNDLTRSLDASLHTTHGPSRIFLIVAHYCNMAVYRDDLANLRSMSFSFSYLSSLLSSWWRYTSLDASLSILEAYADIGAKIASKRIWWRAYRRAGWDRAYQEAAGLGIVSPLPKRIGITSALVL